MIQDCNSTLHWPGQSKIDWFLKNNMQKNVGYILDAEGCTDGNSFHVEQDVCSHHLLLSIDLIDPRATMATWEKPGVIWK